MNWPINIVNDINSVLFPEVCFGCNARLSGGEYLLCTTCRHDLPLTDYNLTDENPVDRMFYGRVNIKKAASFLIFSEIGMVKNLLHYLKYRNQQQIGAFFGDWFGHQLANEDKVKVDVIVGVPLHRRKQRKRGYNQLTLFGKRLAHHLNCTYREDIIKKNQNRRTQTKKNRLARWKNTSALYQLQDVESIKDKKIMLVDDVITTGATMEACVTALELGGPSQIYVVSMAIVPLNKS